MENTKIYLTLEDDTEINFYSDLSFEMTHERLFNILESKYPYYITNTLGEFYYVPNKGYCYVKSIDVKP